MAKNLLWYGYLEAGEKSSPVVLDRRLDTGNPGTVYLFNLARNEILQYSRDIVTAKLRELTPEEAGLIKQMKSAYGKARRGFQLRHGRAPVLPERRSASARGGGEQDQIEKLLGADLAAVEEDWGDDDE